MDKVAVFIIDNILKSNEDNIKELSENLKEAKNIQSKIINELNLLKSKCYGTKSN